MSTSRTGAFESQKKYYAKRKVKRMSTTYYCQVCGKQVKQVEFGKIKKYCSNACKMVAYRKNYKLKHLAAHTNLKIEFK